MACVWCSYDRARGYESRGFKTLCLPSAPYAQRLVTSTVALAAVVVELEPEARTGSRRSIMTDDSRPNYPPAAWNAVMQRVGPSVFVRASEDPSRMTYSGMALIERGLLATTASETSERRDRVTALRGTHKSACSGMHASR